MYNRSHGGGTEELDSYCAQCTHKWACEGCPIDAAKNKMVWLLMEARIKVLGESLDQETIKVLDRPCRHLVVLPGGKKRTN